MDRKGTDRGWDVVAGEVFSFSHVSFLNQDVKLGSPEPARSLPIKPKDASLAPPSGKSGDDFWAPPPARKRSEGI